MHNIHTGRAPKYLVDCVSPIASSSSLRLGLRSSHTAKYVKHTTRTKLGERAFSYSGPAAWNALPASLHDITDISKILKNHLRPSCSNEHSLLPNCFTVCCHCSSVSIVLCLCFTVSLLSAPGQHCRAQSMWAERERPISIRSPLKSIFVTPDLRSTPAPRPPVRSPLRSRSPDFPLPRSRSAPLTCSFSEELAVLLIQFP